MKSWLPAFQFLAKAFEMLMQGSIGAAVLAYLRYEILREDSLPFGALFSGLQTTSVSYLWSMEFLGSATSPHLRRRKKLKFVAFVSFSILLAATVGPSMAIALIPRRQQFPAGRTFVWTNLTEGDLYPMTFSAADIPPNCLMTSIVPRLGDSCPSSQWAALNADLNIDTERRTLPMQGMYAIRHLRQSDSISYIGGRLGYEIQSTIPQASVSELLARIGNAWTQAAYTDWYRWDRFTDTQATKAKQPIVRAVCADLIEYANETVPVNFAVGQNKESFSSASSYDSIDHPNITTADVWRLSQGTKSYHIKWVDLKQWNVSLGAIFIPPNGAYWSSFPPTACSIFAGWAPVPFNISTSDLTGRSYIQATVEGPGPWGIINWQHQDKVPVDWGVKISAEWAEALAPNVAGTNMTVEDILVNSYSAVDDSSTWIASLSIRSQGKIVSGLVANGMARAGFHIDLVSEAATNSMAEGDIPYDAGLYNAWVFGKTDNVFKVTSPNATAKYRLEVRSTMDGYAYTLHDVPTIVAVVILSLYCLYTLIFLTSSIISGVSSCSWDTIAELTVLAMLSSPPDRMKNASAGIETMELFQEPVSIKVGPREHLEIVLARDNHAKGFKMAEDNVKY